MLALMNRNIGINTMDSWWHFSLQSIKQTTGKKFLMLKYIFLILIYLSFFSVNANSLIKDKPNLKQNNNYFYNKIIPNFSIYSDIKLLPVNSSFSVFHLGLNKAVSENTNLFYNVSTSLVYKNHQIPSLKRNEIMTSLNYVHPKGYIMGLYAKLGEANYEYSMTNYSNGIFINSKIHKYHTSYTSIGIKEGKLWSSESGNIAHELSFNIGVVFLNCNKRDSLESPYVFDTWFLGTSYRTMFYKGLPIVTGYYERLNIEFSYKFHFALSRKRNILD
jgi:hypothetical protein